MTRGPVHLHIDTLVLHGFSPGAAHQIGDAIQQELTRLIVAHGAPPAALRQAGEPAHLDAGRVSISAGMGPAAVGAQIAGAVYGVAPR
jgi:hypothetical protein